MKCTNCGHEIPNTAKVCGYCGHRLKSVPVAHMPPTPPAPARSGGTPGWVWALGGLLVGGLAILGLVTYGSSILSFARSFAKAPAAPAPTTAPTEGCTRDAAAFIADITIEDGTAFDPGTRFDKIWRLANTGTCPWTEGYQLVFDSGNRMDGPAGIRLPNTVHPGDVVDVSVSLTAPEAAGTHKGFWILRNDKGMPFGYGPGADQPVWVEIQVNEAAPVSNAAPASDVDRCSLFDQSKMTLMWLDAPKGGSTMTMYLKIPGGVPGLEKSIQGDDKTWEYTLEIGDFSTRNCTTLKGYKERLYCTFEMPQGYGNSVRSLKMSVNGCEQPIYSKERTEIPGIPQKASGGHSSGGDASTGGSSCSSGLGASACAAAGGTYVSPRCDPNPCQPFCACP